MFSGISHVCLVYKRFGYFSSLTKSNFLFGYFTWFVNSGNYHLCKFASKGKRIEKSYFKVCFVKNGYWHEFEDNPKN